MITADRPLRLGPGPLVLALLALFLLAALFLGYTHDRAGVWLSAPLDDTFIHFQYAKQLARGHLLQFNDGDPASTGATSFLYLLLLAPGWLLGFRGGQLLLWAWLINGTLHLIGALAVFAIVQRLSRQRALAYAALLCFLCLGALLWGAFSGMEIALFSTLILLTLAAAVRLDQLAVAVRLDPLAVPPEAPPDASPEAARLTPAVNSDAQAIRRARRSLLVCGSLLALVRPEGMLLAGGVFLWLAWRHLGEEPAWRRWPRHLWQGRALAWPVLSALALLLLFLLLTGRFSTNASIKSHLGLLATSPARFLETSVGWLPMPLIILLEKWPTFLLPLTTTLTVCGLGFWAAAGQRRRPRPGALVLGWLLLLTLFYALAVPRRDHFDRYYLPYLGLTVVTFFVALAGIARRYPALRRGPLLVSAVLLLFMLPDTLFWAKRFGDNSRDLAQQHFKVAEWIRQHLPPSSRIAVNDAGAIPYLSGRYSYDIVGLAHNAFYRSKSVIPLSNAPVWEVLERVRPDYLVVYPEWIPDLYELAVFSSIKQFVLKGRTMVANEVKHVYRMRWDLLLDADRLPALPAGQRVVDQLDVADLESEKAHRYQRLDSGIPEGITRQLIDGQRVLVDGGRLVKEGEQFELRVKPGRPATLLLRTAGPGPLELQLTVDGRDAGTWRGQRPSQLALLSYPLPAALLSTERVVVRLKTRSPFPSFHYWIVQ